MLKLLLFAKYIQMKILKKNKILNIFIFFIICQAASLDLIAARQPTTLVSGIGQEQLETATQKAVQTRRLSEIDRLSKERGDPEEEELARQIAAGTTDYTAGETHESSIKNFIENSFGFVSNNLYCVAPERIKTREFVFIDKENGVAVKVFPQTPKHYFKIIHELSGHQALESLHLKTIDLVKFFALGKYQFNGIEYLLLAMSYAEGQEIRKYIENIYKAQDPAARQEAIHSTKEILRKLGSCVGDLHFMGSIEMLLPDGYMEAVTVHRRDEIQKSLTEYQERGGVHGEELKIYFDQLLAQYSFQAVVFSIFHGDAHLANFLYDEDSDRITVIDSVKAHLTADPNGLPISDNFVHDSVKIDEAIVKQILSHENNEELIKELIDAFHKGYDEKVVSIINPSSYALDKSFQMLKRLASSLKQEEDASKQEYRQRSFEYYEKILIEQSRRSIEERNFKNNYYASGFLIFFDAKDQTGDDDDLFFAANAFPSPMELNVNGETLSFTCSENAYHAMKYYPDITIMKKFCGIDGFEGYLVSRQPEIRSKGTNRLVSRKSCRCYVASREN